MSILATMQFIDSMCGAILGSYWRINQDFYDIREVWQDSVIMGVELYPTGPEQLFTLGIKSRKVE